MVITDMSSSSATLDGIYEAQHTLNKLCEVSIIISSCHINIHAYHVKIPTAWKKLLTLWQIREWLLRPPIKYYSNATLGISEIQGILFSGVIWFVHVSFE